MTAYDKLRSADPDAIRAAGRADRAIRSLDQQLAGADMQLARGRLLEDLALTTTPAEFPHGLNRGWTGAFVVRSDVPAAFQVSPASDDRVYLTLAASTAATVDVWVF